MQNSQFPVSSSRPINKVAEAWDAYRASQPEEWEMLADYIGDAYNRRRKL